jgi:1,2-phenylacetyl-CoA epoxidase PaaB subunit
MLASPLISDVSTKFKFELKRHLLMPPTAVSNLYNENSTFYSIQNSIDLWILRLRDIRKSSPSNEYWPKIGRFFEGGRSLTTTNNNCATLQDD